MKTSKYNFIFKFEDGWYAYNSLSDRFIMLSSAVSEALQKNELSHIEQKGLENLKEGKFILPQALDETQYVISNHEKALRKTTYHLTLMPTLDCNVSCWYCFEKRVDHSRMNKVIQDAVVKHIENVFQTKPETEKLLVELFGGEPLLHFEEDVFPLLTQIKNLAEKKGKSLLLLFATNGLCLNERIIHMLQPFQSSFQISIDGYKRKHDSIKKIRGQKEVSSYDTVMKNIALLLAGISHTRINLRINYDNNTLKHIGEVVDSIRDLPRNRIQIHLERVWQTQSDIPADNSRFKEAMELFHTQGFKVTYLNFFTRGYSCKASRKDQVAISYNGSVYKCTGRILLLTLKKVCCVQMEPSGGM